MNLDFNIYTDPDRLASRREHFVSRFGSGDQAVLEGELRRLARERKAIEAKMRSAEHQFLAARSSIKDGLLSAVEAGDAAVEEECKRQLAYAEKTYEETYSVLANRRNALHVDEAIVTELIKEIGARGRIGAQNDPATYTDTQIEWMRAALKAHEKHGDMQNEAKWCRRVLREYRGRATTQQAVLNMFKTQLGWIRTNETADDFDTYYPRIIEKLEKMKADGLLDVEP